MKTDLQSSKESLGRIPTKICSEKYSCWSLSELLTVAGRPGRSTVNGRISDRWEDGRPGQSTETQNREQVSLSVDRLGRPGKNREQRVALGRPGQSTDVHTCIVVHVGRPGRSTGLGQIYFSQGLLKEKEILVKKSLCLRLSTFL